MSERTRTDRHPAHAAELAAVLAVLDGDLGRAPHSFRTALLMYRRLGHVTCLAHCLDHVAGFVVADGRAEQAALLLAASGAIRASWCYSCRGGRT